MNIVDSLKNVVSQDPSDRASKIIDELISPLERPNQAIVHDIISLIHALASNPNPNVEHKQIIQTAKILIDELIKPIPNPRKELTQELLEIIIESSKPKNSSKPVLIAPIKPILPVVVPPPVIAPPTQSVAAPVKPAPHEHISDSAIKLLTGEIKELVKKQHTSDATMRELDTKINAKLSVTIEDVDALKSTIKKSEAKLEEMSRAIDKFLGLYEVIINQYNPFIEHVTPPQVIPPQISQPAHPVVAPPPAQVAPQVVTASQPPITPDALDINGVIQKVRDATLEQDFRALMPAVIAWVEKNTQDAVLLEQLKSAHAQSDVVKLLIKKSLKLNMNS